MHDGERLVQIERDVFELSVCLIEKETELQNSQRRAADLYTTETRISDTDAQGMYSTKLVISNENH